MITPQIAVLIFTLGIAVSIAMNRYLGRERSLKVIKTFIVILFLLWVIRTILSIIGVD